MLENTRFLSRHSEMSSDPYNPRSSPQYDFMTQSKKFRPFISGLGIRMFVLLVFSLILMSLDRRLSSFDKVRQGLFVGASPFHYAIHRPIQTFQYLIESFANQNNLKKENDELKARQLVLSEKLQKLDALEAENIKLHSMLKLPERFQAKVFSAQIFFVDLSPFSQRVVLNKGKKDGVVLGQPVLDEAGVMGQIISISPFTSQVLLITDKLSAVPVQINRNGLRAIAVGSGNPDYLSLLYLSDNSDFHEGDLVVTSGLGKNFPFGYPVGIISSIKKVPGEHFLQVFVKPSAGINKSRHVLLLQRNSENNQ